MCSFFYVQGSVVCLREERLDFRVEDCYFALSGFDCLFMVYGALTSDGVEFDREFSVDP